MRDVPTLKGTCGAVVELLSPPLLRAGNALLRPLPLFTHSVRAGFPSPADDYIEERISLDAQLIAHPEATFFLRVAGDSMAGAGILNGDLLVVDRSVTAVPGHIVIAALDGELTVKQLVRTGDVVALRAANPAFPDIVVGGEQELQVWGVVRWAIHRVGP